MLPIALLLVLTTWITRDGSATPSQPGAISFLVSDALTGQPVPGAAVSAGALSAVSDAAGVAKLPADADGQTVTISHDGYTAVYGASQPGETREQQVSLVPLPTPTPPPPPPPTPAAGTTISGRVTGADGAPIDEAVVLLGTRYVLSDATGAFSLPFNGEGTTVRVSASGYADVDAPITAQMDVSLERRDIKALYLNGTAASYPEVVDNIINIIDTTELNAVVIDIKDGVIYYDSQVAFFRDAGMVRPTYDARALVKKFHDHGIYVIARQVIFKDPLTAEAYPNLAVKDETTGKLWRNYSGEAWVNPLQPDLYAPNAQLAVEAGTLGFDEIQYDYIRFPDGELKGADFGPKYSDMDARIGALTSILSLTRDQLRPIGVKLSADVFGWMVLVDDDQGIGQRFQDIAAVVDYISPMVYPSHFPTGSLAVDGPPNDFPYDTITISMSLGMAKIPGMELKMRPWLQEFTLPGMAPYGPRQVRDQIIAAGEQGTAGWMIWNIDASYDPDSFLKNGETTWVPPVASPAPDEDVSGG